LPIGIMAEKLGMMGLLFPDGRRVPVTVLQAGPCRVTAVRTVEKDGYAAVQLGFKEARSSHLTKALAGQFSSLNLTPPKVLKEFRLAGDSTPEVERPKVGDEVKVDTFQEGVLVDVRGVTKGKGFAGTIKRWHHGRGPTTHGSKSHRRPGSTGSTDAARVLRGKKSPGHMGDATRTTRGLTIVRIDAEKGLMFVRGAVPGANGALLEVRPSLKQGRG